MMDMMNGGMSGWMGGMWLLSLLFWILVIAGAVLVVRWVAGRDRPPPAESAVDILEKRYARGEIDRETFERMRRDIEGKGS